jgi:hypothetical protein
MSIDSGIVTFTLNVEGTTYTLTQSITKAKSGAGGSNGSNGSNGATIITFGGSFTRPTNGTTYYLYPGGPTSAVSTTQISFACPIAGTLTAAYVVQSNVGSDGAMTYIVNNLTSPRTASGTIVTSKAMSSATVSSNTTLSMSVAAGDILTVTGVCTTSSTVTAEYAAVTIKIT